MATITDWNPSNDTVALLNQWLHTLKGEAPAGSFFDINKEDAESEVVSLVMNIVGHGTAYYTKGCVSYSVLLKARKIARAHPEWQGMSGPFVDSLYTGQPLYARSLGVKSESVIA